jgi:DNA polymerase-3 subunit gamma/tau
MKPVAESKASEPVAAKTAPVVANSGKSFAAVSTQAMIDAWPEILSQVKKESKSAWVVAFTLTVMDLSEDVLTLKFLSQKDLDTFKSDAKSTDALRKAIFAVLGLQVKFRPHIESVATSNPEPITSEIPIVTNVEPVISESISESPSSKSRNSSMVNEDTRYGESLLREVLGAEPMQDPKSGGR